MKEYSAHTLSRLTRLLVKIYEPFYLGEHPVLAKADISLDRFRGSTLRNNDGLPSNTF